MPKACLTSHACADPRRLFFLSVLAEGDIVLLHMFSNMFVVNGGDTGIPKVWPSYFTLMHRNPKRPSIYIHFLSGIIEQKDRPRGSPSPYVRTPLVVLIYDHSDADSERAMNARQAAEGHTISSACGVLFSIPIHGTDGV